MRDYQSFLASKAVRAKERGLTRVPDLAPHLFPFQHHCVEHHLRVGAAGCFLDCVAGETLLDSPLGARRIDDLAAEGRPILVYSLNTKGGVDVALASSPFRKGHAALYQVITAAGVYLSATVGHRFLTAAGWRSVSELRPGSLLVVSERCRPASTSGRDLSVLPPDAPNCEKTLGDLTDRYSICCHQYDLRLRSGEDNGRSFFQPQAGVLELSPLWSRKGDAAHKSVHSHHHQNSGHLSMPDSILQGSYIADAPEYRLPACDLEQSAPNIDSDWQSVLAAIRLPSGCESPPPAYELTAAVPACAISYDAVVSIQYLRTDDYYDLHVPGYENYFAHGICSHNTGLGKTEVQLEFCQRAIEATNERAIIWTPLAVAGQTKRRADRWGYEARVIREQSEAGPGINICNYDRRDKIDPDEFGIVSCDEASILKSFTGKTTRAMIDAFRGHRFKLVATATPAPNDHMELGNHSEFLEVMAANEMLSRFFINDTSTASQEWRLKGHAVTAFWDWMASWARMGEKPSDLGDSDDGFALPPFEVIRHKARGSEIDQDLVDMFGAPNMSATNLHDVKRQTSEARAETLAAVVGASPRVPWLIWCDSNDEADRLKTAIPGAIEVRGSMSIEEKEEKLEAFSTGKELILISKPKICGFGLDWSHCSNMAFVGRSYSYEVWYQAVRRCWRFGQKNKVNVHLIVAEGEDTIGRVIDRKAGDHAAMKIAMREAMRRAVGKSSVTKTAYIPTHKAGLASWISAV